MNGIEIIENIAKDIRNREDKDMAMAFTNFIGTLLVANGVTVETSKYELRNDFQQDKNKYMIEKEYGIIIEGLDFTEHDKEFKDEINSLKESIKERNSYIKQLKHDSDEFKENNATVELPFDAIEVANFLINEEYECEIPFTGRKTKRRKYEIEDLEQIAEHLLVYCKHNKEEE